MVVRWSKNWLQTKKSENCPSLKTWVKSKNRLQIKKSENCPSPKTWVKLKKEIKPKIAKDLTS